jgi:hypothetical protein
MITATFRGADVLEIGGVESAAEYATATPVTTKEPPLIVPVTVTVAPFSCAIWSPVAEVAGTSLTPFSENA